MSSRRHIAVAVYDSVTRIADGFGPDGRDRADLRCAAKTMRGEHLNLVWVEGDCQGPSPHSETLDHETWYGLVSETARQLQMEGYFGSEPIFYLNNLADALEAIAGGDRDVAKRLDAFSARLSLLAEMYAPAL